MGPHVANVFDPHSWNVENNAVTLEVMRVVLATGLFAIGVELPQSYMWKHINSLLTMVVSTMAFGWLNHIVMRFVTGFSSVGYGFIDRESYVVQFLALAIFTVGVTSTIGCDDLLAAFAAGGLNKTTGSAISWDNYFNVQIDNEGFSSVIDLVLNCVAFIYIGAWIPFGQFNQAELGITPWRLVVLSLIILALRRIPFSLMLYKFVPEIANWRQALFARHFGVGAVFVSTLAITRLEKIQDASQNQQLLTATPHPIVAFIVLCSIVVHGLSIPLFSAVRQIHALAGKKRTDAPEIFFWNRHSPVAPVPSFTDIELGGRGARTVVSASDGTNIETVGPESAEVEMSSREAEVAEHPGLAHSRMDGVHRTMTVTAGPRDHERRDITMLEGDVADEYVHF
ncbi:Na+/H+ antiporter [Heterobasidion irregulare TC 32-1]|uniref:Na+/H+ antiporter n=1 Tax=Heterobasidion irregulare (strain TC 32-1) TaxID=747525 RepID=W4JNS0_HETIT|nr:Na+/H+ antiporter [Heterobasidion irregulare TC 32-1]ETW75188.1 Na+/H+ antiporter [Heterobasidion irregulare TC 32-1]